MELFEPPSNLGKFNGEGLKRVSMEHQDSLPIHGHQHWSGNGVWLSAGAGCCTAPR